MKSTPSPRVRLLAVLALVLVAGGGAFVLLRGSNSSNSSTNGSTLPRTTHTTTATTPQTTTTKKPRKKPKPKPPAGGSVALDAALISHPVVVVSVYAPSIATDRTAMNEARAGAAIVDAGFATFNVFDEKQARQLADLLGNDMRISNPAVLIFKRPRTLAFELQGFADSQVVAQAAVNVLPREEPWMSAANQICSRYSTSLALALSEARNANRDTATGRAAAASALERVTGLLNKEAQALSGVRVSVSKKADYAKLVGDLRQVSRYMSSEAGALRRNDIPGAQAIEKKLAALVVSIDTLVPALRLSSCAA